ncbi:D-2-hydroxyacid dehydrogenase family protein [Alcaligenaceae bacterium LF4-65]|jgi:phosphoglycerate dehydrogenase-like enzyme|uniref:D-2-hydroxyacid dehydrogenase family protein n=1 Tax=Zwartia hollandica TaxID=324606 RepID=A0A953NAR2_9BURK|nr:D-2-hydroxyacid dehydrogenase family protein [Zwartia hollandica]MBZ1349845.1 D-2-hydroxyacid dehydrogenase family protein [Zwartia hollandica]
MTTQLRLAILDDYQDLAHRIVDWRQIPGLSVVAFKDHVYTEDDLVARLQGFDGVMRIRERTEFPRSVLTRLPQLKFILATGMRNARSLDLQATDELGITVCTTEAMHQSTVEVTWALILGLFRAIPQETASVRAGGWQTTVGDGVAGKTLGIIGLGNMGIPVAKIGRILGMRVIAWSRNLTQERAAPYDVVSVSKDELIETSDVITIHHPLTDSSLGLLGKSELARMKPSAYLVNTSRAQIVDEDALIQALTEKKIGGAALDVFTCEPLPQNHPFRTLPNVIATPHIGFVTQENMDEFFSQSYKNLVAYLAGKPINVINAAHPFLPESQVAKQMHKGPLHTTK